MGPSKFSSENRFTVGDAPCKLPLIIIIAHKSYIVNRQVGVADYKYVVLDDPLPPGHMSRCMRIANLAITRSLADADKPALHI